MSTVLSDVALSIGEFAIIVNPLDNVAVLKKETAPGLSVELQDGRSVRVKAAVSSGHRFATRDIRSGEYVRQYGNPIGTSLGISEGEHVSHQNMDG